jgi:hypothetical protein
MILTQEIKKKLEDFLLSSLWMKSLGSIEAFASLETSLSAIIPTKLPGFEFIPNLDKQELLVKFFAIDESGVTKAIEALIKYEPAN